MLKHYFLCTLLSVSIFTQVIQAAPSTRSAIDARSFLQANDKQSKTDLATDAQHPFLLKLSAMRSALETQHVILQHFNVSENEVVDLLLDRAPSIYDQNTVFIAPTEQGDKKCVAPDVRCYRGIIVSEPKSSVVLVCSDLGLLCSIEREDGQQSLVSSDPKDPTQVAFRSMRDVGTELASMLQCSTPDLDKSFSKEHPLSITSNKLIELEVALETDTRFYAAAGASLAKAQSYALAVFSMVNAVYEREVNIRIHISWLKCWTDSPADPYSCGGDPFVLRDKALLYWETNYTSVPRDVYHVMTCLSSGGGGYGYLDQLCKGKYAMASSSVQVQHTFPVYAFTYDSYIVAHELGHNLNAQHTHSCFFGYPLDTCLVADAQGGGCLASGINARPNPGSIMSYCGGTNNAAGLGYQVRMTFLPQNIIIMRNAAEAAACLTEPAKASISLISPEGSQSYRSNSSIAIRFLSAHVSNIDIEYSTDLGTSWTSIAKNVSVDGGVYDWQAPALCENDVVIRLRSSIDSSVSAQNILPFHVSASAPQGLLASYGFDGNYTNSVCGGFDDARIAEGQVRFRADRFGLKDSALEISGQGYLYVPSADLRSKSLSISLWCQADSGKGKNTIIGTNYGPATNVFEVYNWGILGCSYYTDKGLWQFWSGMVEPKKWTHVVFSYDGSTASTWVNNKLLTSEQHSASLVPFVTSLYIGSRRGQEYFYGAIDDIKIFNRALSDADVKELYTEKAAPGQPVLLFPPDQHLSPTKTVQCVWSSTAAAQRYHVQIATDISFANGTLVLDTLCTDSTLIFNMKSTVPHYIRLNALNAFGLSAYTAAHRFQQDPSGVSDNSSTRNSCFDLLESSSSHELRILFNNQVAVQNARVVLSNLLGQIIVEKSLTVQQGQSVQLDCEKVPAGVYLVTVRYGHCESTRSVVLHR